jgi:hypothetical protein
MRDPCRVVEIGQAHLPRCAIVAEPQGGPGSLPAPPDRRASRPATGYGDQGCRSRLAGWIASSDSGRWAVRRQAGLLADAGYWARIRDNGV